MYISKRRNKPHGYWQDYANVVKEFSETIDRFGRFPTTEDISGSLKHAMYLHGKRIDDFRILFGYPITVKPKGYWRSWDNVEKEILGLVDKNSGVFPTLLQIESELGSPAKKMVLERGGIFILTKQMGFVRENAHGCIRTSDGHYVRSGYEYLFDEFLHSCNIEHEVDGLISDKHKYRFDFKFGNNYVEIWGFDQKESKNEIIKSYNARRAIKERLYSSLGLNLISINQPIFKKPISEIVSFFVSILKENGIFVSLSKDIELTSYYKYSTIWTDEKILFELNCVIRRLNKFPKQKEIKEINGALVDAISRHGGLIRFANMLGYCKKPKQKWNYEKIEKEVKEAVEMNSGCFPTVGEFYKIGKKDLYQTLYRRNLFDHFLEAYS